MELLSVALESLPKTLVEAPQNIEFIFRGPKTPLLDAPYRALIPRNTFFLVPPGF